MFRKSKSNRATLIENRGLLACEWILAAAAGFMLVARGSSNYTITERK